MKIKDVKRDSVLKEKTLGLKCGPFNISITSPFDHLFEETLSLYSDFETLKADDILDFELSITEPKSLIRRAFKSQCYFSLGSESPFAPMESHQAFGMFEWGFNWCISSYAHQYLIIHAAVLEKDGVCVVFPAPPGSGKSTLTALLTYSGWRLLSDELTLIDLSDNLIQGLARPINLKNHSIKVIQDKFPHVEHSKVMGDTHKGDVCLFKPTLKSVEEVNVKAKATHVIFPKYKSGGDTVIEQLAQSQFFFELIDNSFNYGILGQQGFEVLTDFVDGIEGYNFTYSNSDEAIELFDKLATQGKWDIKVNDDE